jgi:hypothetical protein
MDVLYPSAKATAVAPSFSRLPRDSLNQQLQGRAAARPLMDISSLSFTDL